MDEWFNKQLNSFNIFLDESLVISSFIFSISSIRIGQIALL
ncbi:hypothetical protein [Clostridium sp.]